MTTNYSGNLKVVGTGGSFHGPETISGNLGVVLSASLDSAGNGTGTETVTGILSFAGALPNYTVQYGLPVGFTTPAFDVQSGKFSVDEQVPIREFGTGISFGVVLSGSVSGNQTAVSGYLLTNATFQYEGATHYLMLSGAGTFRSNFTPPAPLTIGGAAAGQQTSDTSSVQPFQNVVVTDPNAGQTDTVTATLSDTANGTLANLDGGSYDAAVGVWSDTGTAAAVTAALDGLEFTPAVNQVAPGLTVTTTFTIVAADTAGAAATDGSTSVVATDVAVLPTITRTFAGWTVPDQATVAPFSRAVIADANPGQTETVTVTLSDAANGTFGNLGGGSYNAATGVWSDIGTAIGVTAALNGLEFAPAINQVAPGLTVTTTFSIVVTDTAGGGATDSTTSVIATDAAVPPTITGTIAGQTVTDQTTIAPFSGAAVADANSGQTEAVTVVLYDPANGTLENLGGGSYDATTGVWSDAGTAAAVTAALDGLVFDPAFGQVPVGQTIATAFSINVTDTAGAFANDGTTSVITTEVPCYLRGTRIATPAGERAVESLAAGDLVLTQSGEARPITWIGHRRIDCRRHRRPRDVFPVRVRAGAFGDRLPARDLRLSPDHAVFMRRTDTHPVRHQRRHGHPGTGCRGHLLPCRAALA